LEAVDLAVETTKQLITLSSAIIAIAFTFLKNFEPALAKKRAILNLAVTAHFFAIVFGVWTLLAVTGGVATNEGSASLDIYRISISLPAILQIISFLVGMFMMILSFILANRKIGGSNN